jgi:O-antigen/teichoic acid export membrane protein
VSLARHTAYNLTGQLLPLAASLLVIPVYLPLIGEARFGVLALIWLLVGYTAVLDLGVGQAATRELARMAASPAAERTAVLRSALALALGLGTAGAVLGGALGSWYFEHHAELDATLLAELKAAWPWALFMVPLVTMSGVLNGALQASGQFAKLNLIGVAGQTLMLLAPLAVATHSGVELVGLVIAVAASRLAMLVALLRACSTELLRCPDSTHRGRWARQLIGYGGWTTVSALVAPLLLAIDRVLIGAQLGAPAVTHYTLPFQLAERTTALATAFGQALFPRLAATHVAAERQELALRSLRLLAAATAPVAALGLCLAGPFLAWWISEDLATRSTRVALLLCFAFWMSSLATVPYILLLATGRPKQVALVHLLQLPPYLALIYLGLQNWGIEGAAAAFAIRVLGDLVLLLTWAGLAGAAVRQLALPFAVLCCATALSCLIPLGHGLQGLPAWIALAMVAAWSGWQLRYRMPFSGRMRL